MFDTVFLAIVGNEPVPFSKIRMIVSNEPVIPFTLEPEITIPFVNRVSSVSFNSPAAFLTNVGKEPVPSFTISNTISNELLDEVIKVFAIEAVVVY